jgi:tetratricopeptide (TPR) repeat protein
MATIGVKQMQLVLDPYLEATRSLEEGRHHHPTFADIRHLLGLLYLAKGDPGAAVVEFEASLQVNPEYRRARFNRLVALRLRDGSLDPALWSREGVIEGVDEPDRSLWTAWFLAQSGDRQGARVVLERLKDMPPFAALAQFARGLYETTWKETKAGREAFETAAGAHPLYREILQERGWIGPQGARGKAAGSGAAGKDGAPWDTAAAELYEYLGTLCARLGRCDEALGFYREAFLRQGNESLHQIRMSQLALARSEEEEAVRTLCRAIEVDPTSVPARIALGFEYQSQGFHEEALVQFEVAARLKPEYPDVQYNLGLLYDALGRGDDSILCLRKALEANPAYFQARTSLAQILLQQETYEEALAELNALSELGLRSADLHVQKAEIQLALSQPQKAVQELEQAIALNPAYARSYYVLGSAYRNLGLRRKARSAWQQYLDRSRSWRDEKPTLAWEEGVR